MRCRTHAEVTRVKGTTNLCTGHWADLLLPPVLHCCLACLSQMQQLSNTKTSLQATIQKVQESNAQLQAKLSTLRGMVSTMAADNHQLQAANCELREQVQAVVRHLQEKGIRVPDLGY